MKLNQLLLASPTPAIVSKQGVRRLPRWVLLVIVCAYLLAGFIGRAPWKHNDIVSTALMHALAMGQSDWLHPSLLDQPLGGGAYLPYWLGAWAIQLFSGTFGLIVATQLPYLLMLAGTLVFTWYGTYYLALNRSAQPLAFAFGGEASPHPYASAIADGSLLALIASLGLAQLGHEVGPLPMQVFFVTMLFASCSALRFQLKLPLLGVLIASTGLGLSGAPTIAALLCLAGVISLAFTNDAVDPFELNAPSHKHQHRKKALAVLACGAVGMLAPLLLNGFSWKLDWPLLELTEWQRIGRLFLWFLWPLWPFAFFTIWQWRRHLTAPHLFWPLCLVVISIGQLIFSHGSDWAIAVSLPAFAVLAAFSLPALNRGLSALIDWLTLVFFTICGLTVWVMWVAMLTGWPKQPAANVKRLVPGFVLEFSWISFALAMLATLAWFSLVRWRTARHRSAIWKSLVLPAGGTLWAWILLMTLWLPVFNYARSYIPMMEKVTTHIPKGDCVIAYELSASQLAALHLHGPWVVHTLPDNDPKVCKWMISNSQSIPFWHTNLSQDWDILHTIGRPSDKNEDMVILKRKTPTSMAATRSNF